MISDQDFEQLINEAIDELPKRYLDYLKNVAIVIADEPDEYQKQKTHLEPTHTLLGLYEGVPLTQRGNNYNMVLPDKITLFKLPLLHKSSDLQSLKKNVKHTLWHEIAHYYGLDHDRIEELENK